MKRVFKVNFLFLAIIVLQISIALFGVPLFSKYFSTNIFLIITSVLFIYTPAIIYIIVNKQSFKKTLRLNKLGMDNILSCFAIFLLLLPVTSFCNLFTSIWFKNNVPAAMESTYSGSALLFFLTLAVMPAIGEELVMRGVILDGYKKINIHKAALINGFLFGIMHLNPPQFLYAFILGTVFSYLVIYTNSIFSSMFIHFLFNGLSSASFIIIMKSKDIFKDKLMDKTKDFTATTVNKEYLTILLISGICAIIALFVIAIILKKIRIRNNYAERVKFEEHTFNLEEDENMDEFLRINPKKSKLIAYSPVILSILIFISLIALTVKS